MLLPALLLHPPLGLGLDLTWPWCEHLLLLLLLLLPPCSLLCHLLPLVMTAGVLP